MQPRLVHKPQFICPVCFKSVSSRSGEHCGLPRLDLADSANVELVREYADRLLRRMKRRELFVIWSVAGLLGLAVWLGLAIGLDVDFEFAMNLGIGAVPVVGVAISVGHARLFPGSARATLAARDLHASSQLPSEAQLIDREQSDWEIAQTARVDPRLLPLAKLLDWVGAKNDD